MPVLFRYLEPIMEAFNMLSSSRQMGAMGGVGPISLGEIITYLKWEGIESKDEQKRVLKLIRSLDNAFVKYHAERNRS